MKLENISKIFGVLAFISFVLIIPIIVGVVKSYGYSSSEMAQISIGMTVIFLLSAILVTLKRVARDIEESKKE